MCVVKADIFLGEYRSLEDAVARFLLKAVESFSGEAGRSYIADLLKGRLRSDFIKRWERVSPLFGVLSGVDRGVISGTLRRLVEEKYISFIPGGKLLAITPKGIKALNTDRSIVLLPAADLSPVELEVPEDLELYEKLKALRDEMAEERGCPPYVIFQNRTLLEMALEKPRSYAELLEIWGVGEKKAEEYGRTFLEVIENHM